MTGGEISKVIGVSAESCAEFKGPVTGISIDSRNIKPGDLFVCLPGERVDGHNYAVQAEAAGACGILAQKPVPSCGAPVWQVQNCERALGQLAAHWRKKTKALVIGITGTAGKTTLKDALAALLSAAGKVACTKGNLNNQLGLPLTLLQTDGNEDFWVVEAGISRSGDMDYLGSILRPDLGIILNIGPGHTEGLGDKGVAWHKSRLLNYLAPGGKGLVNSRYAELVSICKNIPSEIIYFGGDKDRFRLGRKMNGGIYEIWADDCALTVKTPYFGEFGGETALAAAAAGFLAGLDPQQINSGFQKTTIPQGRGTLSSIKNFYIIDATYNANPVSMRAMIATAAQMAAEHNLPLVLGLGEMGELGDNAEACHEQLGEFLASVKPFSVIWKGRYFQQVKTGYEKTAPNQEIFFHAQTREEFASIWQRLKNRLNGGVIMMKGSRVNQLENNLAVVMADLQQMEHDNVL